jgi:hypothetical protein
LPVIEAGGGAEFLICQRVVTDPRHPNWDRARDLASAAGIGVTWPERRSSARRSASSPHARSSSESASSRLASRASANRARTCEGSCKSSASSCSGETFIGGSNQARVGS